MTALDSDAEKLATWLQKEVLTAAVRWPGGRPGQIEAALVDSVLSIRARYGRAATDTSAATGVQRAVDAYKKSREGSVDDLTALSTQDAETLANILGVRQKTSGRTKASAIVEAASNLVAVGVAHGADVRVDDHDQKAAWTSVRGLAVVTWKYFGMLLGSPGVKADTWVIRGVSKAVGRRVSAAKAEALVHAAAQLIPGKNATDLDHAIWAHMRVGASSVGELSNPAP
ncbi:hypothetical protein [Klenkia terrae]|uniref:Uncharacterized protein n=1 Tax=Klenkia terrae TaxID=1052259 RepID=A0ABU8E8Z0_9ACTN|nr:hypothetical protein [Klenkia terrae]SSC25222.1 Hypothetical protein KLENKIAIHU_3846 [Klenkia terrae]